METILKRVALVSLLFSCTLLEASAQNKDTTIKNYVIEGVTIITTPKETYFLNQLPASTSILNAAEVESGGKNSIKGLSGAVPNLFIPDYGSKITSAIYIRGIGSRFSPSPSIGLYEDNVPFMDKSAFDFEFLDVERVEILRGPQGTLYGRNALGGIVHIRTRSPFSTPGTEISFGAGTYGQYKGSFITRNRLSERLAFSLGGFYKRDGGFFTNDYTGISSDQGYSAGGKLRLAYNIAKNWKIEASGQIEHNDQNAYPYGAYNKINGNTLNPSYNDTSSYKRLLNTASLVVTHNAPKWRLNLISAYQNLSDTMRLDQDFTARQIYTMRQSQRLRNFTQEAIFKSENTKNYQFVSGVSGFYQSNFTDAPVNFGKDGVKRFFQDTFDRLFQTGVMPFHMNVTDNEIPVYGEYDQKSWGFAAFHQVNLKKLFFEGLSLTLGLRYEYEHQRLEYLSGMNMNLTFNRPGVPRPISMQIPAESKGVHSQNFGQFLPKISLQYSESENMKLFYTSARGYKAGGYNIQMFSDIVQAKAMSGMPGGVEGDDDVSGVITYRPEYNWNHEIGFSGWLLPEKLNLNASIFYIDSRDQQVVQFAGATGFGRVAKNAGSSFSTGGEISALIRLTKELEASANWGYTYSKFTEYTDNQNDYTGKFVPFVPRNTLNANIVYTKEINRGELKEFSAAVRYNGAGKIYWTEKNDVTQPFYSTIDIEGSVKISIFEFSVWMRNFTDSRYNTFYFETLGNGFAQLGRPFNVGAGVKMKF
jgi:outer membrane receptor protein involved in Fe transport